MSDTQHKESINKDHYEKYNPEAPIIDIYFYEALMNKESLKFLPTLLNEMDENLGITVDKFCSNPLLQSLKIETSQIIEIVKNSKDFHYDKKSKMLKFKKKADLNLIIFPNFEISGVESIEDKIKYLKSTIFMSCKLLEKSENLSDLEIVIENLIKKGKTYDNFPSKLKRIVFVDTKNIFQISFESEYYATQAFSFFESLIEENYFSNLKEKPAIVLAAETLKRRILRDISLEQQLSTQSQISFIRYILKNPTSFSTNDFFTKSSFSKETNKYEHSKLNPNKIFNEIYNNENISKVVNSSKRNSSMNRDNILKNIPSNKVSINSSLQNKLNEPSTKETEYYNINNKDRIRSNSLIKLFSSYKNSVSYFPSSTKKNEVSTEKLLPAYNLRNKFDLTFNQNLYNHYFLKQNPDQDISNFNQKVSKHKLSNIIIPKEHKFSCNFIDHNKNRFIFNRYDNEKLIGIFLNMANSNNFKLPAVFDSESNKYDEEIFLEIGIPIPKTLEERRTKKINTQSHKYSCNSYYNNTNSNIQKNNGFVRSQRFSFYNNQEKPLEKGRNSRLYSSQYEVENNFKFKGKNQF